MLYNSLWGEMNIDKERVIEVFRLCGCDKKYYTGAASEYEMFREILRIYPLLERHELSGVLRKEICRLLGCDGGDVSLDADNAADMWKKYNILEQGGEYTGGINQGLLLKNNVEKYNLKIENVVFANDSMALDLDFEENVHELALKLEKKDAVLGIDLCADEFTKPNPYLARQIYENAEKYNKYQIQSLYCQVICEIYSDKKHNSIPLFIKANGHICAAKELLEYMHRHNMTPRTFVGIDARTDVSDVLKTCGFSGGDILITPCIIMSKNNINIGYDEYIKDLSYRYPIGMTSILYM